MRGSGSLHWQGRVRRSPCGVTNSAMPAISAGSMGLRRMRGSRSSAAAIRSSPSSGSSEQVQKTSVPPGRVKPDRALEQARLEGGKLGNVGLGLAPGNVGMAADRAGRGAGRVQKDGVERARLPGLDIGDDQCRGKIDAPQIVAQPRHAGVEAIDRGHLGPGKRKLSVLPPGAAQRSATERPRMSPSRRTGSAAAASCTHQAPSA